MKNPWMSLWLSAANKAAGTARGLWMAEAQRQSQAFGKELVKVWTQPLAVRKAPVRRK